MIVRGAGLTSAVLLILLSRLVKSLSSICDCNHKIQNKQYILLISTHKAQNKIKGLHLKEGTGLIFKYKIENGGKNT